MTQRPIVHGRRKRSIAALSLRALVVAWGVSSLGGRAPAQNRVIAVRTTSPAPARSPSAVVVATRAVAQPTSNARAAVAADPAQTSPASAARASRSIANNTSAICTMLTRSDRDGRFLSRDDVHRSASIDGDALDAVVSRGAAAALPSSYAPSDLLEVPSLEPITARECVIRGAQCLRRDAAHALVTMLAAMRRDRVAGHIHSSFRSYSVQCMVFGNWAYDDGRGFCRAATGSALPGHSQHQLGTTLDLLTAAWRSEGRGLSADFGCSPGGRWLAAHAEEYGFVLPYPLFVDHREGQSACAVRGGAGTDPRTGYNHEPWHLRYVGPELVAAFAAARARSAVGTPSELTLDQWLRRRAGREDDGDLPVCDGCACGACSTLDGAEASARSPCPRDQALVVDADGAPVATRASATIATVEARRQDRDRVELRVRVEVEPGVVTQTPVAASGAFRFEGDEDVQQWRPRAGAMPRAYRDLRGAVRLAIEPIDGGARPRSGGYRFRVGLASGSAPAAYNGAALDLPAPAGRREVRVSLPSTADRLRVALWIDGHPIAPREVTVDATR